MPAALAAAHIGHQIEHSSALMGFLVGAAVGLAVGVAVVATVASGGAAQSPLACQMLADSTGLPVALPEAPEPVLLGAAMLGAIASGAHADAGSAMAAIKALPRIAKRMPV